jgi:hypothetical protein
MRSYHLAEHVATHEQPSKRDNSIRCDYDRYGAACVPPLRNSTRVAPSLDQDDRSQHRAHFLHQQR